MLLGSPGAAALAPASEGAEERFAASTRDFTEAELRALGAVALEQRLGKRMLAEVGGLGEGKLSLFLARASESGLLLPDRAAPAITFAAATVDEEWFAVHPDYEQIALRVLHAKDLLRDVARLTRELLEARSVSDVTIALQDGDLVRFERAFAQRRLPRRAPPRTWCSRRSSRC